MSVNRREFIVLSVATIAGCQAGQSPSPQAAPIDAGAASDYASDGLYNRFAGDGFFIVRNGKSLFAISSYCTHRRCRLNTATDHSFYCKCHGSTFDPNGKVTEGPATKDLPLIPSSIDANGHLIVHFSQLA